MQELLKFSDTTTCPYLGLKSDSGTAFSYPSVANYCYHCQNPAVPLLSHQESYCLSGAYSECPVYSQEIDQAFPPQLIVSKAECSFRFQRMQWRWFVLFIGLIVLVSVGWFAFQRRNVSMLPIPLPASIQAIQPTGTTIPLTQTQTPLPTTTPTVILTATTVPFSHALDTPITIGDHQFLIHRVTAGQTFDLLSQTYSTTSDVIKALNYSLKPPLTVNKVIVISPSLKTIDPSLPAFETYHVIDASIAIDDVAKKLAVDATQLRLYNACNDDCPLVAGNWLIVPISK